MFLTVRERLDGKTGADGVLLTLAMIVRNEEKFLRACLESFADLVCEITILDTGSTDNTVAIAEEFGARIFHEPWQDDFALHRNQALSHARGEWIIVADADNVLVQGDAADIRHRLATMALPDVLLVREHVLYPDGRDLTVVVPKLFRASAGYRFIHRVHEQLDAGEQDALLTSIVLRHDGYLEDVDLTRKQERNLRLARQMEESPHALHCRARAAMSLKLWDEVLNATSRLVEWPDAPRILRIEGCTIGATAAFNAQRDDHLEHFLTVGKELAPESPDIRFIELLRTGRSYLASLEEGDSQAPGMFLRPWLFWHDAGQVQLLLETLVGKRRLAEPRQAKRDNQGGEHG